MNKAEVDALRRRLREEFERDMAAVERVEALLSRNGSATAPAATESEDSRDNDESQDGETLIAAVERVFASDPKRTWTIAKLEKHLLDSRFPLVAKNPRPSISVAVRKLITRGRVKLFKRGAGVNPHSYRADEAKETGNDQN
jgi:tryptophan 2,3-dioxygenase